MHSRLFLLFITLCITHLTSAQSATPGLDERATYALIKRVLPAHALQFTIASLSKDGDKDAFELESQGGKIVLRGNNGVSVASALKHYLNEYAHCDISWNGTNLNLPSPLPVVPKKVHKTTPYQQRYYLNYCTFNYTMSWWDWPRWQQEIDWMALNGINLPLAITGQNSIWERVYKSMGLTDKDLSGFYSGPTFFNWFWMGNIDGWGGPLPQSLQTALTAVFRQGAGVAENRATARLSRLRSADARLGMELGQQPRIIPNYTHRQFGRCGQSPLPAVPPAGQ